MNDKTQDLLNILGEDGRHLHLLLARLTLREDVAADLMQELFLRLQASSGFSESKKPRAYVRRAAINLAFDWRRRQQNRPDSEPLETEPAVDAVSLADALVDREEIEQILAALDTLPRLSRGCVVLRYLQQEEYDAIGEQIGKTPHQVRALCYKAISQLRKLLLTTSDE